MTEDQKTKVPNLYLIQNDSKMDSSAFQFILDFSEFLNTLSYTHQKIFLAGFIYQLPESERVSLVKELLSNFLPESIDSIAEHMIDLISQR